MSEHPLSSEEFRRVEAIFSEIADLDPETRERRLSALERDEPRIAAEVRRVLDFDDEQTVGGSGGLVGAIRAGADGQLGESIGPYRLVEVVGEGGMGVVYLAEQSEPVQRRVALKLIKLGMDTAAVVARFEAERQSLALMSHPHIAQVFDAGATDSGRPYFVMEYVPGQAITRYCAERRLTTRQRIALFLDVCDAVQHAHQKGVIHRDLTAANVLVAEIDGKPVAKIIDFGIAKATDARHAQRTLFTEAGQVIGTPEYMSPEQADLSADVDTRTDVYSLGVLLYELLTGRVPFHRDTDGIGELLRSIREREPTRPSVVQPTEARTTSASELRGDLDWITMRALEKERERRYDSAAALAEDLRRHLSDEPVLAGPPTTGYRMAKFIRRNRVGVLAAGLALAALVAGTAGTTIGLLRAQEEAERARQENETRREVIEFLAEVLGTADTSASGDEAPTAREMVDQAAARARERFEERPLTQAIVLDVVGDIYRNMHDYDAARPVLEEAYRLRDEHLGPSDGLWESALALGRLYRRTGDNEQAQHSYERCLEIAEQVYGADSVPAGDCLAGLGILAWRIPDYPLAESYLQRAFDINAAQEPPDLEGMAGTTTNLSILQNAQGDHERSVASAREAIRLYREFLGEENPRIAGAYNTLANALVNLEQYDEAVRSYDRAMELWALVAPDHPNIGRALHNIGYMYQQREMWPEALEHYDRALENKQSRFGPTHSVLLSTLQGLTNAHDALGDHAAGLAAAERALPIAVERFGEQSVQAGSCLVSRARALKKLGRSAEAERELERAADIAEATGHAELAEAVAGERAG